MKINELKGKERVEELTALIDEKIEALISSNDWKAYLKFASAQYRYSWNNQFLIMFQSALRGFEATYVRGYRQWEAIDRTVKKGEKAMYVLAPMIIHRCVEKGCEAKALYNKNVKFHVCTKSEAHRVGKFLGGFKDVPVFDISQTEGEEIPQITLKDKCENASEEIWNALVQLAENNDFKVIVGNARGAEGYCSHEKKEIVIDFKNDFGYRVKVLAHEVGHLLMHKDIKDYHLQRARYETEAEGVAWVVCEALGVHSAEDNYSFGYIATWGKDDTKKLVKQSLQTITKTAWEILDHVEAQVDNLVSA